ncbi:hypothetical protein ABH931_006133 [Streptacidiphilus sp. MAP12-33]|uniref:hypothetical protein n=1 Tax=Streptacidiphilus sp. MAP12-33 TaxID=3156266 RepID=UPI0035134B38
MSDFAGVKPPGWPHQVDAPGRHDGPWEQSAVSWLLSEVAPGAWREGLNGAQYRRHPLMLARDALYLVDGQLNGLREAYRRARVELGEHFEPQQIEEQLAMYAEEAKRLEGLRMKVQLVYDALSGVRWVPRA